MKQHFLSTMTVLTLVMIFLVNLGFADVRLFSCVFFGVGLVLALRAESSNLAVNERNPVSPIKSEKTNEQTNVTAFRSKVILETLV